MTNANNHRLLPLLLACQIGVAGCESNSTPAPPQPAASATENMFRDVAADYGVQFVDSPQNLDSFPLPAVMGSGCAVLDYDRNGRPDLLLLAEHSEGPHVALYSQQQPNVFSELSRQLGLQSLSGTGVAVGDVNNDGWPDLYITSTGRDSLWLNDAGQRFTDVTRTAGINNLRWGVAACWVDYDRDGWLDLFVANYVEYSDRPCTRIGGGDADFCSPALFDPTPDLLLRNVTERTGQPAFEDVTQTAGIASKRSAGLAVTAADFTGDGWIDLYVASDQRPNRLWVNRQGHFTEEAGLRGCDVDHQGRPQASMGLALADVQGDQREELLVAHLDGETHAVYSRGAGGLFTDECRTAGVGPLTRPLTGFGVAAVDFDLDGVPEILTVNGRVRRSGPPAPDAASFWTPYQQPLQLLTRRRSIDRSTDHASGPTEYADSYRAISVLETSQPHMARGLAVGDLDRDGDVDALVSTIGEPALVLRNETNPETRRLWLRFVDEQLGGRSCAGALVRLMNGDQTSQFTFQPVQSYGSTHLPETILPVPAECEQLQLDIVWPHGPLAPERFVVQLQSDRTGPAKVICRRGRGNAPLTAQWIEDDD